MVRLGKEKVTQSTLAEALQISRNTVARVLNNQPGVAEHTRKAVLEKAYELGYALPGTLGALEAQTPMRHREVALLGFSDFLTNFFWSGIIQGLEKYLSAQGITLRLVLAQNRQIKAGVLPDSLSIANLDAIIVMGTVSASYYHLVQQLGLPTITYDTFYSMLDKQPDMDVITLNNEEAVATITERLIQEGHRHIAYVGALNSSASFAERRLGFEKVMKQHQLSPIWLPSLENVEPHGYIDVRAFSQELTHLDNRPTAYVCANDSIVSTLIYMKKTLPALLGDAALTSFDNFLSVENTAELYATVEPFTKQLGHMMAVQLCTRLQEPTLPYSTIRMKTKVLFKEELVSSETPPHSHLL